jgi:glycosyltransferase involved in cell wall biosynthesis
VRLGFIVPRYGLEVHGGAEHAARLLAEHVAARPGWSAEVFTTCAQDAATWQDAYAPGTVSINGVTVHRFRSRSGRGADFAAARTAALRDPGTASSSVAARYVEQLGPVCPDAVDAAEASTCPVVAVGPYLYHPTVTGVAKLGRRAILHAAAHDEPDIRLPIYLETFARAGAFVHWSEPERSLVSSLFPATMTAPQLVLGLGVEPGAGDATTARRGLELGDDPYVLCLGRTLDAKGSTMLARFFAAARARRRDPLQLVFAGPIVDRPPSGPGIRVLGPVDDATKWGLLRGATALVSPSPAESLSIVLLESWSVGTPVLVNGACPVTVDQCTRSGGGLWFDSFGTFDVALDRLTGRSQLRRRLGDAGRAFVERHYTWPVVIDRYARFVERVAPAGVGQLGFRHT